MSDASQGIDYAAVLADLEAKKATIEKAIAGIKVMLGQPVGPAPADGLAGTGTLPTSSEVQPDSFFGLSIPDSAKKFLGMRRRTATTPDIAAALKKGGQPNSGSEGFQNTVGTVLARAYANGAGIVRVSRGTWGLAEWYPNKPRRPKSQDDSGDESLG